MPKNTEKRSPDQDAALETAFVEGVLPEEDRRADSRAPLAEVDRIVASLPPKSRITWSNEEIPAGVWRVQRGTPNSIGEGPTLRRALRLVGAKHGRDPQNPERVILLDEQERPIDGDPSADPDPFDTPPPAEPAQ